MGAKGKRGPYKKHTILRHMRNMLKKMDRLQTVVDKAVRQIEIQVADMNALKSHLSKRPTTTTCRVCGLGTDSHDLCGVHYCVMGDMYTLFS